MKTVITIEDVSDENGLAQISLKMEVDADQETLAAMTEPTPAMWAAACISSTFQSGELLARTQRFIKSAERIEGTPEGQAIIDRETQEALAAGRAYIEENEAKAAKLREGLASIGASHVPKGEED